MLRVLTLLAIMHFAGAELSGLLQARKNRSQRNPSGNLSGSPALPDYLKKLGCTVFWKGEYVKCEGCKYDDAGLTDNHKVVHGESISTEDALNIMTQSGIDVFSQLKVPGSSAWEFHGVNFDTKKTPIWTSTFFKQESLQCGRKDAMVVYLRMRAKYRGSVFFTKRGREDLKTLHLIPAMDDCYVHTAYKGNQAILNEMLAGMDEAAQIGVADSVLATLITVPLLFLPEVDVSISLLSRAFKDLCQVECAEAIKVVPEFIKGNVLDPAAGIVSTIVSNQRSKVDERVKAAMVTADLVMNAVKDLKNMVLDRLSSMTNQEIMYWIARFNTTDDPVNNCSLVGAEKYMKDTMYWYKNINKMGFDHVSTRHRSWIGVYNGWCWKGLGKGSWYVEGMISSGYDGDHTYCELPDESKWKRIPQEYMMTAIFLTPDAWNRDEFFNTCKTQHPECHTYFNKDPDSRRRRT